ncbi:MAG: helix-turn-helix domain-containing protein, partial [Verrucomicrobiia bacterium]
RDDRGKFTATDPSEIKSANSTNCGLRMNTEERLKRLFAASPEQVGAIDGILESGVRERKAESAGPLLLGMTASAKFLGVSRTTLWRMVNKGLLQKIEILPGSFRLRRADLEAIANKN